MPQIIKREKTERSEWEKQLDETVAADKARPDWERQLERQLDKEAILAYAAEVEESTGLKLAPVGTEARVGFEFDNTERIGPTQRALNTMYIAQEFGMAPEEAQAVYGSLAKHLYGGKDPREMDLSFVRQRFRDRFLEQSGINPVMWRTAKQYATSVQEDTDFAESLRDIPAESRDEFLSYVAEFSRPVKRGFWGKLLATAGRSFGDLSESLGDYMLFMNPKASVAAPLAMLDEVRRWKAEHGGREPPEEVLRDILGGALERKQKERVFEKQVKKAAVSAEDVKGRNLLETGILGAAKMTPAMATGIGVGVATKSPLAAWTFWYTQTVTQQFEGMVGHGVDPNIARNVAMIGGIPHAYVEMFQAKGLMPHLGEKAGKVAGETIGKYMVRKGLTGVKTWGKEWGEEVVQSIIEYADLAVADVMDRDNPEINYRQEFADQVEGLKEAAVALPFMMAPGGAVQMGSEMRFVSRAKKAGVPGELARGALKEAGAGVKPAEGELSMAERIQLIADTQMALEDLGDAGDARVGEYLNEQMRILKEGGGIEELEEHKAKFEAGLAAEVKEPYTEAEAQGLVQDARSRLGVLEGLEGGRDSELYKYNEKRLKILERGANRASLDALAARFGVMEDIGLEELARQEEKEARAQVHPEFGVMAKEDYIEAGVRKAQQILADMGIKAEVRAVSEVAGAQEAFEREGIRPTGAFRVEGDGRRIIELAFQINEQGQVADIETFHHEAEHALREALEGDERPEAKEALAVLNTEFGRDREVEAAAFGEYGAKFNAGYEPQTALEKAFDYIYKLLKAIRAAFRRVGFRTAEDVWRAALEGRFAQEGQTQAGVDVISAEGEIVDSGEGKAEKIEELREKIAEIDKKWEGKKKGAEYDREKGEELVGPEREGEELRRAVPDERGGAEQARPGGALQAREEEVEPEGGQVQFEQKKSRQELKFEATAEEYAAEVYAAGDLLRIDAFLEETQARVNAISNAADRADAQAALDAARAAAGELRVDTEELWGIQGVEAEEAAELRSKWIGTPEIEGGDTHLWQETAKDMPYDQLESLLDDLSRRRTWRVNTTRQVLLDEYKRRWGKDWQPIDKTPAERKAAKRVDAARNLALAAATQAKAAADMALDYQANRPVKRKMIEKMSDAADRGLLTPMKEAMPRGLVPMSSRIEDISPRVFRDVRYAMYRTMTRTSVMSHQSAAFLRGLKEMQEKYPDEYADLGKAFFDANFTLAERIIKRHGLEAEYAQVRAVLDEIYRLSNTVGMDVKYLEGYWARHITDYRGLMNYLLGTNAHSAILQAIKNREAKLGRPLREEERAKIANSILRGYMSSGIRLSRPGHAKERAIEALTGELRAFYAQPEQALLHYIGEMNSKISAREFFGRETRELVNLRAQRSRLLTRLSALSGQTMGRVWTLTKGWQELNEVDYAEHIKDEWKRLGEVEGKIEEIDEGILDRSVGRYVADAVARGEIKQGRDNELANMLRAIFEPQRLRGKILKVAQNIAYGTTLANPFAAATQLKDQALSYYRGGLAHWLPELVKAAINRSEISPAEFGIEGIGQEFNEEAIAAVTSVMMEWSGFAKMDRLGKTVYVNTVLNKYRSQAQEITEADIAAMEVGVMRRSDLFERVQRVFGEKTGEVIQEIRTGHLTENVKILLFNELLDVQPIAISEMPEGYAAGGNWRLAYMMKSFTIRQIDFIRRECIRDMMRPETFARGFGRLLKLGLSILLFGAGVDTVKDLLRGKEVEEEDIMWTVADNALQYIFMSKYTWGRIKREGLRGLIDATIIPPTRFADAGIKGVLSGDLSQMVRNIPVAGEPAYWWLVKEDK